MTTKRWLVTPVGALALVATLCATASRAEARFGGGRPMFGGAPPMGGQMGSDPDPGMQFVMILRSLDLTPEQREKVRATMESHRPAFRELFTQLRTAQDAMATKLFAPGPLVAADVTPAIQKVAALREQLMAEGVKATIEVRSVLTPEQLAKAADVRQRLEALHGEIKKLLGEPSGVPPSMP